MNKKGNTGWIIFGIIALVVPWGIVGHFAAQDPGVTCDMGLGDLLCWKWHTNALGEVAQLFGKFG